MDVAVGGIQHAHSKNEAFSELNRPNIWGDLHIRIGVFGSYRQFLPLYEMYIITWRYILSKHPKPGKLYKKKYMELMHNLWTPEVQ